MHLVRFSRKFLTPFLIFIVTTSASYVYAKPVSPTKDHQRTIQDILSKLDSHHYKDLTVDDSLSSRILDKYLDTLDPAKVFFYSSDIKSFQRYQHTFDDDFKKGDLDAGFEIYNLFQERLNDRLSWVIDSLKSDTYVFDFNKVESMSVDTGDLHWPADQKAADELWRKRLKAGVLSLKLAGESEESAREKLERRYENQLNRMTQKNADDAFEVLANSIANLYDPHTTYLSPRTEENFNISMSLSLEGIGAVLKSEDEFTEVVRLIAAGPADKQGQLAPADRIVGVAQGQKGEMVDVVGWRLDEVVDLIRGKRNTLVRLEVIPSTSSTDSERVEIKIRRDKVKLEEQAAKKAVLDVSDGEGGLYKIGVINVPTFYFDFDAYRKGDKDARSTTRDVYKLIKELENENIDGLVLDLRNNGGGSLREAALLTDLFVDPGPVVQIRQSDNRIARHNYASRYEAVYKGNLLVLTNRLSASASEIFAGAIQDYNRGLVVGAQSFGKGTVQTLTQVHKGRLKLTESKFYRISGESTQHRGVVPDVEFPFLIDPEEVGESSYETALPWDKIHRANHGRYEALDTVVPYLTNRHKARVKDDPDFIFLQQQTEKLKEVRQNQTISLNEEERLKEKADQESQQLAILNERQVQKGLEPYPSMEVYREEAKAEDAQEKAKDQRELDVEDDAFLNEASNILVDFISFKRNSKVAKQLESEQSATN